MGNENLEQRVDKLEEAIQDIRKELKQKAVTDARIEESIKLMSDTLKIVQTDTSELRSELLSLVTTTLERTREDLATFLSVSQSSEEKTKEFYRTNEQKDKDFYRKLITSCIAVFITIVLAFFGLKAILPM